MTQDNNARSLSPFVLDTNTNNCGHDDTKVIKFAQRKSITKQLSHALIAVCDMPQYHRMSRCADTLCKQDDVIVSQFYCQNRLCTVCSTHRSQRYYLQYADSLKGIGNEWHMVTLTIPNVPIDKLRSTIKGMKQSVRAIFDTTNKRHKRATGKGYFHGITATECTYNKEADTYHPHFHILVHGSHCSDHLIIEWLKHNDTATIKAQDDKKLKGLDDSLREIFKYSIKGVDSDTPPQAVHNMAQAFRHLRAIQPFGDVKAKKLDQDQDEQEAVQGDKVKFDPTKPFIVYRWYNMNWYDSNGKPLIDDDTMQFSRKTLNTLSSLVNATLKVVDTSHVKYDGLHSG